MLNCSHFEATRLADNLDVISRAGEYCEHAYDWLVWAFRTDLGVLSPEPPNKPPVGGQRSSKSNLRTNAQLPLSRHRHRNPVKLLHQTEAAAVFEDYLKVPN